jgi:hypothetical protein
MSEDNVTPITPTHVCASCKATIDTRNVYEGHTDACMQPEVRMRRLERMTAEHRVVIDMLSDILKTDVKNGERMSRTLEKLVEWQRRQVEEFNQDVIGLLQKAGARLDALEGRNPVEKETHVEEPAPITQRSGSPLPVLAPGDGLSERTIQSLRQCPCGDQFRPGHPIGWCQPYANAGAAEPPGEAPAGAVPAGSQPERAG